MHLSHRHLLRAAWFCLLLAELAGAAPEVAEKPGKPPVAAHGKQSARRPIPVPDLPCPVASLVLGRVEEDCVAVSVLPVAAIQAAIEVWEPGEDAKRRTQRQLLTAGVPATVALDGLAANRAYEYRLIYRRPTDAADRFGPTFSFHTQRPPGSSFLFELQGDSHPERPRQHDPALYAQTLRAAAADHPDFYLAIGDDFSVDTLRSITPEAVGAIYRNQHLYLGLVGHSAPLVLVNGNHEQAAACNLDGTANNVAVWAQNARNRFFPQPAPDGFYTGDRDPVEHIGLLRDYHAWTWGDALFVVIDPYWHSAQPVDNVLGGGEKARDLWGITLGDAQYHWLQRTLAGSTAAFKFVFAHHVLGTGRGGIEQAGLYEWGGADPGGRMQFAMRRPGWELPIHQLMAQTGVTIFFQGHDHVFVRQELDGVVYQTLPEPADPSYTLCNGAAYRSGNVLPNSGRVRVTVSPERVQVEYVRSYLPADATPEHPDGEIAFRYEIPASDRRATK